MAQRAVQPLSAAGYIVMLLGRTRSATITKTTQQPDLSPQVATAEKKKAKIKNIGVKARKILSGQNCISDKEPISHDSLPNTLMLIIKKYSAEFPHQDSQQH
jgi:hypothetical protein